MAQHETYSLGIDTNFDSVLKANKAINAMYEGLKKVNSGFSGMHAPRGLPAEINHMSAVTASYVQRLESEGKTYEANKVKSKAYAESLNYLNRKQKSLETQLGKIAEKSGKTSQTYKEQQVRINATATSINKLRKEQEKLHPTGFNLLTSGAKKATTAIDKAKTHMHNAFESIKTGASVAAAGIVAVGATAMSGAKMAGALQQRYREINNLAVLGGEKQKEVTKSITEMQRQGRDMSIKYGKSQQEIAAGYEDLVKRGYKTKQAVGALKAELQASVASGDKFSDVTTVSSQVLDAFGMRAKSTGKMLANTRKVVNELAYSADATSTGFGDIGTAMSYVGTAAKANNISLAETASALGVLSNNGLESDKAGTALRATINGLTNQVNKIGKKNSIFDKLGIKKSEMLDAHGNLKSLSTDMGVLYKHIEEHSKGGSEKNGFFRSIFGTSSMNGAMILAKSSKEVEGLTKRTEKAGKTGTYVAKLAAKNMGTAQGSANSAKQAMNAFKMTLGNAVLPAINQASNALAKFLLSKDGKKFQKDVGGAVAHVANGLVKFIKWGTTHKGTLKAIGGAILAGYTVAKGLQFVAFLGDVKKSIDALKGSSAILNGIGDAVKAIGGKSGTLASSGGLVGKISALKASGGVLGGTVAKVSGVVGTGLVAGGQVINAIKDRHNADKRSQDIGGGIGAVAGGALTSLIPVVGPLLAPVGAEIGKYAGRWGGKAVDNFTKGWQRKKPPKSFWSLENLGWSTHNMFKGMDKGWNSFWGGMGDWRKKESRAFGRWASQTGRSIKKGFNGAKTFVKNIPSNLGKTGKSIKKWADNTGQNIHKGWNRGITASHKFFKNLPKNIDKTKQNIGKWSKQTGRNISSAWRKGQKATVSFVKHIPSNLGKAQKSVERWGRKTGKNIGSAWHKGTTAVGKFVGSIPSHLAKAERSTVRWAGKTGKNIHSAWDAGKRGLTSFVTSIPKQLGKAYTATQEWAQKTAKTVHKAWDDFWGKAGDIRKGITNNVKAFGNDLAFASGHSKHTFKYEKIKSHASGGLITATHHALVGEAGPELAYKRGLNARLLGARGPQITRVHAGEHILNARDTAKVLSGGLGAGVTLKGYAGGTDKLKKTSRSVTKDYKDIADKSTKSLKKLARSNKQAFSQVNKDANKQTKQAKSRTVSNFNSLHKNVSKLTARTKSESVSNFKSMHKGINRQMDAIHDGVIRSGKSTAKGFGGAMDKMHKYAHSAMADTTRQLNKGISSIDKVLGQFGGNNSVIKPIKFAKGTDENGRLTHNTLAMVNDATHGPRQEALVSPDNKLYLPKGQNVQLMLPAGWGVLNGKQTKQIINKTVNHYAKGTGISHSALRKLAKNAGADPSKWFKSTYSNDIKQHGSDLNKGTTALGSNSSTKYGNPWSNALWGVINKQIDSDDGGSINATGLLKAAEKYGEGHKYVLGATGPDTFDCSGLVMYTLKHAYGIDYPHFSGSQYNMTRHISRGEARMGDLVFWGAGGSDHVGIYAGGNNYFSAESPAQGIHMNTLDSVVGKGRPLFGRIKGIPSQKSKAKHVKKPDSRLTALVKRELGSHALKWIKDNLGEEGGSFGNPAGDGVARWRKYIIRAASQMHTSVTGTEIAKILSMISSESSGNPTITQQIQDINSAKGTPAQGLLQFVPSTFNAFAVKGHHKLLNGYDQLLALFNDSNWRNDIHFGGGWGPSGHRRFAKGGRPKVGQNVIVGEHGPEIARFDSPVQIYSNEKSRRSLNLGKLPDVQHASSKKHFTGKFAPVININFNGSASDFDSKQARKIAEIVQRELEKVFNSIDEEFC